MKFLTNRQVKSCLKHISNICNALTICCLSATTKEDRQTVLDAIEDTAWLTSIIGGLNGLMFVRENIDKEGDRIKEEIRRAKNERR